MSISFFRHDLRLVIRGKHLGDGSVVTTCSDAHSLTQLYNAVKAPPPSTIQMSGYFPFVGGRMFAQILDLLNSTSIVDYLKNEAYRVHLKELEHDLVLLKINYNM